MTRQLRGFVTSSGLLCDQYELGLQRLDHHRMDVDLFSTNLHSSNGKGGF